MKAPFAGAGEWKILAGQRPPGGYLFIICSYLSGRRGKNGGFFTFFHCFLQINNLFFGYLASCFFPAHEYNEL